MGTELNTGIPVRTTGENRGKRCRVISEDEYGVKMEVARFASYGDAARWARGKDGQKWGGVSFTIKT